MPHSILLGFAAILILSLGTTVTLGYGDGSGDRVLLRDIKTITLHHGHYTNGRRSAGVPQLKCTGGSAGCNTYTPSVVQCKNTGSDGYDAQWECKSEMPNRFKFGRISVTCEGYSSPDDPYVLRGSCGLEYSLELTSTHSSQYHTQGPYVVGDQSKSSFGNLLVILAFIAIAVAIYYTCIQSPSSHTGSTPGPGPTPNRFGSRAPPPAGFRSDYYPNNDSGFNDGCGSTSSSYTRPAGTGTGTGGGFWTGAATGGLLGYMFGANNSNRGDSTYTTNRRGYQDSYFGTPSSSYGFGGAGTPASSSSSSGTSTSTGYGGTKRR